MVGCLSGLPVCCVSHLLCVWLCRRAEGMLGWVEQLTRI